MRQVFRVGILVSALLIVGTGCAATDWVRNMFGKGEKEAESGGSRPAPLPADGKRSQVQALNVQFGSAKWDLDNTAQTSLLIVIKKLRDNPKFSVDLEGYADSVGSRDYNLWLSQKRVAEVRRYLMDRGVEPARIRSVGVGQVADRGTPDEQAKNRRVTVKLMVPKD